MVDNLVPETRRELFLAQAAGQETEELIPMTREERWLEAIARGGSASVFVAEYDATPFADVLAAYEAGNVVIVKDNSSIYQLSAVYKTTPEDPISRITFSNAVAFRAGNTSMNVSTIYVNNDDNWFWESTSISPTSINKILYWESNGNIDSKTLGELFILGGESLFTNMAFRMGATYNITDASGKIYPLISYLVSAAKQANTAVKMNIPSAMSTMWGGFIAQVSAVGSGGILHITGGKHTYMKVVSVGELLEDPITVYLTYGFGGNADTDVELVLSADSIVCIVHSYTVTVVPFPSI